jgi:hypothetical protein
LTLIELGLFMTSFSFFSFLIFFLRHLWEPHRFHQRQHPLELKQCCPIRRESLLRHRRILTLRAQKILSCLQNFSRFERTGWMNIPMNIWMNSELWELWDSLGFWFSYGFLWDYWLVPNHLWTQRSDCLLLSDALVMPWNSSLGSNCHCWDTQSRLSSCDVLRPEKPKNLA